MSSAQPVPQSPSDDAPPPYSEPVFYQQTLVENPGNTSDIGNPSRPHVTGGQLLRVPATITQAASSSTAAPQQERTSSIQKSAYAFIPRRAVSASPFTSSAPARTKQAVQKAPEPGSDKDGRKQIANETLAAINSGGYKAQGVRHPLIPRIRAMCAAVEFIAPQTTVQPPKHKKKAARTLIEVVDMTTLDAVRWLEKDSEHELDRKDKKGGLWDFGVDNEMYDGRFLTGQNGSRNHSRGGKRIGVLTSASPYTPAGGFRGGEAGQELSVARASTLSVALESAAARPFYDQTCRGKNGAQTAALNPPYHTHALVYVPGVTVFRDERGAWTAPLDIDVVSCTAVHAGDAHDAVKRGAPLTHDEVTARIQITMTTRLSRVLSTFAKHQTPVLVLPAFGAGAFNNSPARISSLFGKLLVEDGSPFKDVFDRVVFAVPGRQARVFEEVLSAMDSQVRVHKPEVTAKSLNTGDITDTNGLRASLDGIIPERRRSDKDRACTPPIGTSTSPSTSSMPPAHRPRARAPPNKITVDARNGMQTLTLSYGGEQGLEEDEWDIFGDNIELDSPGEDNGGVSNSGIGQIQTARSPQHSGLRARDKLGAKLGQ